MAPYEEAGRHRPANAITSYVITISRHFRARPRASRHTRFEIAALAIAPRRRERLPRVASTRAARCRGRPTRRHCRGRAPAAGRCAPATRRADAAGRARHNSRTAVASRPASARTLRRDAPALPPDRPHRAVTAIRPTGAAPADDRVPPRAPQDISVPHRRRDRRRARTLSGAYGTHVSNGTDHLARRARADGRASAPHARSREARQATEN